MIRWQWCALPELSAAEIYAVMEARARVFVVEQRCAYLDLDGYDLAAQHLVAWSSTSSTDVAAYLRVLAPSTKYAERSIGRVITSAAFRGQGLGRELMARGVEQLDQLFPTQPIRIGAQAHLAAFYGSFGFTRASEPYIEDGIPHIEMYRAGRGASQTLV
ncbi:MAG: GNAT family N-acetyltransferase [Polyangiales bacterium]